jgi:Ca2+-binding EF-hand superfamily protein
MSSQDQQLKIAFEFFDVDGDGHITSLELKAALEQMGQSPSDSVRIRDKIFPAVTTDMAPGRSHQIITVY